MYFADPEDTPITENESNDAKTSKLKSRQSQLAKIIEPLPGPSTADWKRKENSDGILLKSNQKQQKIPQVLSEKSSSNCGLQQEVKPECLQTKVESKKILSSKRDNCTSITEHTVMDRYGRQMSVKPETVHVLKQLPDLSFLSARTLLFNPEQKQIVQDLGAMINRKMPG